eukprot:Skav231494  [mRNA]  locus=scaffold354:17409:28650:- [translate_table: standard]
MGADRADGAPVLRAEVRRILGEKTPEELLGAQVKGAASDSAKFHGTGAQEVVGFFQGQCSIELDKTGEAMLVSEYWQVLKDEAKLLLRFAPEEVMSFGEPRRGALGVVGGGWWMVDDDWRA